ncbi:MAG: hypothetical protein REI96_02995 [Flavobacterium nitrogenifigens]|uniref:hypothetical protein n=1 Tax=Flavobacterium nitrogenifigens TaxID=1617283 RepID=UPI002808CE5C|nr:hypothetical protein [Flavobacterium nitrogenifigens]MDQ8011391.1 hypothetical protein [Flavobacterium nitrogenifigens]
MTKIQSANIPKIDFIQIINKEYFYTLKKEFISLSLLENQELYQDFMSNPNPNLKSDKITIFKSTYEVSEEHEEVDKYGTSGLSGNDIINTEVEEIECDFYLDFLIPGIEKGKKAYLIDLKKSLVNADKFKDHILIGFFSEKKLEIRTVLNEAKETNEFRKNNFSIILESCLNSILNKINTLEKIYLPSEKINLSLNKAEALLLFHALYEKEVFTKSTTKSDLGRFIDRHVTYFNLDKDIQIKRAYDSTLNLNPLKKEGANGQRISFKSIQRLQKIEEGLFDFLENNDTV